MSNGYVQCGHCEHEFDSTIQKDGKISFMNPPTCPKCGYIGTDIRDPETYKLLWKPGPNSKMLESRPPEKQPGPNRHVRRALKKINRKVDAA